MIKSTFALLPTSLFNSDIDLQDVT